MRYSVLFVIFTWLFPNAIWSQTQTCLQNQNHPNNHVITQVVGASTIVREYILHVPTNYDENVPTPLIINLHGFGDCATEYSETIGSFYDFDEMANEENIIVAYPQGAYRPEKDDTYWEPGDTGVEDIYENDVYFIEELIADIAATYNLNSDMIFACGYSNGGMMAYSLACNRSNLFAAIGIMSGTMLEEDCTVDNPVPIIKFHGIADEVLPYNGGVWYQSVEDVVNFWLDQNGISNSSLNSSQLSGGKVFLDEYSGGNSNSCISLYTINEEYDKPGDHVWFSEAIDGTTPNQIMWEFFKNNCATINSTEQSREELFTIYPNPFNDLLVISNAMNQDFYIYDLNGKIVQDGRIGSNADTINLKNLQAGYFTIRIGNQISKLLKVK